MFTSKSLATEQKERLQEVADLMLKIYETLVDMRYVDRQAVVRGPHKVEKNMISQWEQLGLDQSIIYLYTIMPYIDEAETDARDFFQGGAFFNPMAISDVERGRDPCYASPKRGDFEDEKGEYMYPWYTPLSVCGNHSPIMIYDAKDHRIWIIDQIDMMSTDPKICKKWYEEDRVEKEESTWGDSGSSNWSDSEDGGVSDDEDGASQGDSEYWDDEDNIAETQELEGVVADQSEKVDYDEDFEHVEEVSEWERRQGLALKNQNSLENASSRNAGDVLRDINAWYRELKEVPGQGEYSGWLDPKILKPAYRKNGWPSSFNGDQFEVDVARAYCVERAKYDAEDPLRQVECYEGWIEHSKHQVERYEKQITEAKTTDEEWIARFEIWKSKWHATRNRRDLRDRRRKAEKLCPGGVCQKEEDLPLWELEKLTNELQHKRRAAEHEWDTEQCKNDPKQLRLMRARQRRAKHELEVYEKAFEAAKADADRACPGKTFEQATGIKNLGPRDTSTWIDTDKGLIEDSNQYLAALREFAATVPDDAKKANESVEYELKRNEESLDVCQKRLESHKKWLIEHGENLY